MGSAGMGTDEWTRMTGVCATSGCSTANTWLESKKGWRTCNASRFTQMSGMDTCACASPCSAGGGGGGGGGARCDDAGNGNGAGGVRVKSRRHVVT